MGPLHLFPTPVLALSCIFVLQWSLVNSQLQHDPRGSWSLDLHDTKVAIGAYFNYSLPPPPSRKVDTNFHYELSEVGTSTLPTWLVFNNTSHTLQGVPLITDKGFYLIKVSLVASFENASSPQAHDVFALDVDFETSTSLTKKDILEGAGARPHQMLYTVHKLTEHISCQRNEIKTLMSVVFDADINQLNGESRVSLISRLAPFVNQPLEEFRISSKHSSVINKLQADTVVAAGPGNVDNAGSRHGIVVSWPLPCATQALINQFPQVMARNIASGHFKDTTGYDVISWFISKVRDNLVKVRERSRREAGMTVVPTPRPSQTASVLSATSLLYISSTIEFTQSTITPFISTLFFSPSSSEQTISFHLSSPSGFLLSTTSLGYSSTQISLYSQSAFQETLTSLATESIQMSNSQSPFMTGFSTFVTSSSSLVQVSQLSPTLQHRTTIDSSYVTTIMDFSESTIGVGSSPLLMTSNAVSPSTTVFVNTTSLVGSPSLFLSTAVMSTSLLVTESPSTSSDESFQPSSGVSSVMLTVFDSSNVFPSTFQHRTTIDSSYVTTIMDFSESTIGVGSSPLLMTSNAVSPSTTVFVSTTSLVGSPSLFLSTAVMSTPLLVTESPSMSSDEAFQPSSSVSSVMPTVFDSSNVFPSTFLSTLQSSEPQTSFILKTSSAFESGSPLASTDFPRTSSLVLSSTLSETSDFESITSLSYTSVDISTPHQTAHTSSASTLLSTQLIFSSPLLTTFYSSSETIMSSTESLQTSSSLTFTSYIATSSESTMTFSNQTLLTSEIQSSFFSTQSLLSTSTELPSSVRTTYIVTAASSLPTSQLQTDSQSSEIFESMTLLTTATMAPSVTLSSSYSESPGTLSPALSPSSSVTVLDTLSSQQLPSTLIVTPSTLGMISSSFAVPDMNSMSSVIAVSTLSSTGDIMVSFSLPSDNLSSTDIAMESTYLSEILSSTVAPVISSESLFLSPSALQTTEILVSTALSFPTTALPFSTSETLSQIQSSEISSGTLQTSAPETEMTTMPITYFQTPIISSVSDLTTLVSEQSSSTPVLSESTLVSFHTSSTSDFPVLSTGASPSLSSAMVVSSSTPSVSVAPSERTMTLTQDTPLFSATSQMSFYSSSASDFPVLSTLLLSSQLFESSFALSISSVRISLAPSEQTMTTSSNKALFSTALSVYSSSVSDFPVFSTIVTPPFSSVSFASSMAPIISSVSDSLTPTIFPSTASQETTSFGLESDYSSTTLFISELQSETPTLSSFGTSTSQQIASSSSAVIGSSFSQSDFMSSMDVQPSLSTLYMLASSLDAQSTQYTSTVFSLTSSEASDLSSGFSDSQSTFVPSLITSSVPETSSLVSTLSSQLSTSSQSLSTMASSELFSTTQDVFLSSSPGPTSSPGPSTLEVMPSSTITLSSSPTVVQPSSTSSRTSGLSSLPSSDVSLLLSSLPISISAIRPTPSYSSEVEVVSTVAVTTELTTQPAEPTTELVNQEPIIQYPIDEIIVALGDVLHFSIPEDTFLDPEDGLTPDLRLDLLTTDNQQVSPSHWLQLDSDQQTLAGVPLDSNLTTSRNEYLLSATDSEGHVAYDAFIVKVEERALDYNHMFVIALENDFQRFVDDSQNIVSLCEDIASFLDDANADAVSVASVVEGSVIVTYSNKTISTKYCDYEVIDDVYSSLAYPNGTPTDSFQDALLPSNVVTNVEKLFLNLCSMTTMPPVTNVTESLETGTNLLLVTVLPACLISLLLLICFFVICCCYKRKRGGEEFLLREEKPIYAKNRKPVYLDGELEDKEPRGASHPVILPIDVDPIKSSRPFKRKPHEPTHKPRPLPPQYRLPDYARVNLGMDYVENDYENDLYEMEPPTYTSQPVLHNAPDFNSQDDKPPPLYRLPPPYQSQDRGFFNESDI